MSRRLLTLLFALLLAVPATARASDQCGDLLFNIATLTLEAYDIMDWMDGLEAAIAAPDWDPVTAGWMVTAHDSLEDDLLGDMNQVAAWTDHYRTLQCM